MLVYQLLQLIDDNPFQARGNYAGINELAGDIKSRENQFPDTRGLIQVPHGRFVDQEGRLVPVEKYLGGEANGVRVQLAFGHRRLRAFRHNGAVDMPIQIRNYDDDQMLDAVWSENENRSDLSDVERAELLQAAMSHYGATQAGLAEKWGISRSYVANQLRLLKLPAEVQVANRAGILSARQASALLPLTTLKEKLEIAPVQPEWSENYSGWGTPVSPDTLIRRVVGGNNMTSDQIRTDVKRIIEHAGSYVPDVVATRSLNFDGIEQETCKGCRFRLDQRCVNSSCLDRRMECFASVVTLEVANEMGLPVIDRADESLEEDREVIRLALNHKEGRQCLGVGWRPGRWGVRPFCNDEFLYSGESHDEERNSIVIVSAVPMSELRALVLGESSTDHLAEFLDEWKSRGKKERGKLSKKMAEWIKKYLAVLPESSLRVLFLLFTHNEDWEANDMSELVSYLTGNLSPSRFPTAIAMAVRYEKIVTLTGLQIVHFWGDETIRWEALSQMILGDWATERNYEWSGRRFASRYGPHISNLLQGADDLLALPDAQILSWLKMVADEVAVYIEDEEE